MTLIIVHQIAAHLHLAETVGLVKLDKRSHITGELSGTEPSGRSKSGGLDANAAAQQIIEKVVISRKRHAYEAMMRTQFHAVGDQFRAGLLAFRRILRSCEIDFAVELALPFQVLAKFAPPFLKPRLVDCS